MTDKIKILFHNLDGAGVNYFRTLTPAQQLERDHSDKFRIDINPELDFNKVETIDMLKTYHIIHYHRQLTPDMNFTIRLAKELKDAGVTLVMDIDDYWYLDKTHPFYRLSVDRKLHENIIDNMKIADFITTTTDIFAEEIKKITGKDNVHVLPNAVDPSWMKQFQDNREPDPNGLVRINYMAGSSHLHDMKILHGVVNRLENDEQTKGKFKMIVSGWDTEGSTTDVSFNKEFGEYLRLKGLWNKNIIKSINKSNGDIDKIDGLSSDIKELYRGKVFLTNQRAINSDESVYLVYEKILTDDHKIIKDQDYLKWLDNYERGTYHNEDRYARRWTQKANIYATVLDETDISIAPLADHKFNKMKSNLKQVECWSRKIPIVCTDIAPYNVDGVHERNCLLVPNKKNQDKYWFKYLKRLILDEGLRNELGNNLYDDFSSKFHLGTVTNKRAELYESIVFEMYKV